MGLFLQDSVKSTLRKANDLSFSKMVIRKMVCGVVGGFCVYNILSNMRGWHCRLSQQQPNLN